LYILDNVIYKLYDSTYTELSFPSGYDAHVFRNDVISSTSISAASITPQSWRDVTFASTWNSTNNVLVKFYEYFLYDVNGELIEESGEIYSSEIEWTFRGLQTNGDQPEDPPVIYYITLKITDEYGKQYEEKGIFRIKYTPNRGTRITLETEYLCEE